MSILSGGKLEVPAKALDNLAEFLFEKLKEDPQHILIVDGHTGIKYSRKWILDNTYRYVKALYSIGLTKGDVISVCSENSIEMLCIIYAALYLGVILNPLNFAYTPSELRHMLEITKPKAIFTTPLAEKNVFEAVSGSTKVIVIGEKGTHFSTTTSELLRASERFPLPRMAKVDQVSGIAGIFSSSGTTGAAKGVAIPFRAFAVDLAIIDPVLFTVPRSEVKFLSFLPWFHLMGFFVLYYLPWTKIDYISMNRFEPKLFLAAINKYQITSVILVPPIVVFLSKDPIVSDYDLSSLREIYCGAAPLQADTENAVYKRISSLKVIRQGYGMTEALAIIAPPMPPKQPIRTGSVGLLSRGTEAKVVDTETGALLGPNQPGELRIRGGILLKEYYRNEEATKALFDNDGFLCTGDVGYYDDDGYFFIVDRLKELIKYNGYQVPPAELETLLLTHPGVKDAAVIGIPNERTGELAVAYIVRQFSAGNQGVTEQEILDYVASKMSSSRRLHGGVCFIDEIPKNTSGKILRRVLRELNKTNGGKSKL